MEIRMSREERDRLKAVAADCLGVSPKMRLN